MKYFLGIDLGTTNIKAGIIDEYGEYMDSEGESYTILSPHPGWAEQDPLIWWKKTITVVNKIIKKTKINGKDIKGIGFSGQMHGLIAVDNMQNPLINAIIWADQRVHKEVEFIKANVSKKLLTERLGSFPNSGFTAPKVLWFKRNKRNLYNKTHKFLFPKDFIRHKITGDLYTEYSDASASLLFDLKEKNWSWEMLKILELDIEKFPNIVNSNSIIGEVKKDFSELTNIPQGTPVVAGGGDQPCTAIGNLVINKGMALITVGTGGQLFFPTNGLKVDSGLRVHTLLHAIKDTYYIMGAIQAAGASLKWWMDNITNELSYTDIDHLPISVPGAHGLLFAPYLFGERSPYMDDKIRGAFVGISFTHKREDFVRAIMEGVSFAIKQVKDIIIELGLSPDKFLLAGGITKSKTWSQLLSDILGEELWILEGEEKAVYGAALLALNGIEGKKIENIEPKVERLIKPDEKRYVFYNKLYDIYKDIYESQRDLDYRLFSLYTKGE